MSMNSPCSWPIQYAECDSPETEGSLLSGLPPAVVADLEEMATDLLYAFSGRQFGICDVVLRPCKDSPPQAAPTFFGHGPYPTPGGAGGWLPVLIAGAWFNVRCGACSGGCACFPGTTALRLPGPVVEITEVWVDGEIVPATSYRLDYGNILIRTDGQAWPTTQDLTLDYEEPGTFAILYRQGKDVPVGGQYAAGLLVVEMGKAYCNDASCQLPKRVQTITRQGVTVGFMDNFETLDNKRLGIFSIDAWLESVTVSATPTTSIKSPEYRSNNVGRRSWRSHL